MNLWQEEIDGVNPPADEIASFFGVEVQDDNDSEP